MEYFFPNQCGSLLYTFAVGVAAGVLYDALIIKRNVFGFSRIGMFIGDFLFCIISYTVLYLCVLKANYGMLRWYELMCPFASFVLYRSSMSHLTVKVGTALLSTSIRLLKWVLHTFFAKPVKCIGRFVCTSARCLKVRYAKAEMKRSSEKIRKTLERDAMKGFITDRK